MTMPTMWTLNQAKEATGLSYEFLRKLCLKKEIVCIKTGNKYLINAEKLRDYLNGEGVSA